MDAAAYRRVFGWNTNRSRQACCWRYCDCAYKLYILRITAISNNCDISRQGRPVPTDSASSTLDCPCCPHFPHSKCEFSLSFLHSLSLMTSVINNSNVTCVNKSLARVCYNLCCTCLMPVTASVVLLTAGRRQHCTAIQRSAPHAVIKRVKFK